MRFLVLVLCSGPDWFEFGDFCYKPFGDKKTWHDAQSSCRALGAELVSILSMTEQSWLEGYLYMGMDLHLFSVKNMNLWIETHCFHKAITSVSFLNWAPNEPNAAFHPGNMAENCVEMYKDGRWNDNNCLEKKSFACRHPQCKHFSISLFRYFNATQM
uniref:C-type lectin domain-containing protein n=1 Tax=Oreochromis niloticus TaxID=8128 RepID=A0A669EUJ0_ORENI